MDGSFKFTWAIVAMVTPKERATWTMCGEYWSFQPSTQEAQPMRTRKSGPTNSAMSIRQMSRFLLSSSQPNTLRILAQKAMKRPIFVEDPGDLLGGEGRAAKRRLSGVSLWCSRPTRSNGRQKKKQTKITGGKRPDDCTAFCKCGYKESS